MIALQTYDGRTRWYNPAAIVSIEECQHFEKSTDCTTIYANGDWSVVKESVAEVLALIDPQ